ncbi:hypothetical protein G6F42_022172 [Rhizopus arrhizus]|nr:hypothetical protein G6F42_022172 [Rhizopus arrhizus]
MLLQRCKHAEFFTLKGQFLAKLNQCNEANEAFVNAVQIDLSLPRAWAEWGRYNDGRFKENPTDLSWANNAVSCYLQAAGIYKNSKARKYLLRVLWLLSLDDANGTISRAFEGYKGEWPVWYWVTFIPQLLMGLQQREAKHARAILIRIAKQFPQALHFQLRTAKEDMMKRSNAANAAKNAAAAAAAAAATSASSSAATPTSASDANTSKPETPQKDKEATDTKADASGDKDAKEEKPNESSETNDKAKDALTDSTADENKTDSMDVDVKEKTPETNGDKPDELTDSKADPDKEMKPADEEDNKKECASSEEVKSEPTSAAAAANNKVPPPILTGASIAAAATAASATTNGAGPSTPTTASGPPAHPLDEIMAMLKTGYPLLALSMETMVDQIQLKFKPQADEDMYRLVVALYNEGAQQLLSRLMNPSDTLQLTSATIGRFCA